MDPTTSTSEFRNLLESATGIPALRQEVLAGFPPRPLDLTSDVSIAVLGIKAGDMLTVRESVQALREPAGEEQHTETASEVSTLHAMEAMVGRLWGGARLCCVWGQHWGLAHLALCGCDEDVASNVGHAPASPVRPPQPDAFLICTMPVQSHSEHP